MSSGAAPSCKIILMSSFLIKAVEGRLLVTVRERTLFCPLLGWAKTGDSAEGVTSFIVGVVVLPASDSNSKPGMGKPLEILLF